MSASAQNILEAAAAQIKPIVDGLVKFFTGLDNEVVNNGVVDIPTLTNLVTSAQTQVDTVSAGITASAAAAAASAASAAIARDAAILSRGIFGTTAQALSNGVSDLNSLVGGSGGTDGTYALAFSGGGGADAAGTFTVTGGAVTALAITYAGSGYSSAPALSFAACPGLTGASAVAVITINAPVDTYFSIPVSGVSDALILYRNVAGVATEITRFPSSAALTVNAGKINGWPDPFFRMLSATSGYFLGAQRIYNKPGSTYFNGYTIVQNAVFNGQALRRLADQGTSNLDALLRIYFSEMNAAVGDAVTVYILLTGTGLPNISGIGRFQDASGVDVGGNQTALNLNGTPNLIASAVPQWLRWDLTIPANATAFYMYPYTTTAGATFDIVALWAFKGGQTAGPSWPTLSDAPAVARGLTLANADIATIQNDTVPAVDFSIQKYTVVTADSTVTEIAATSVGTIPRDMPFTGWGQLFTPAGVAFNAINISSIVSNAALETSQWATLNLVIRTGASPQTSAGTIIAVGSLTCVPEQRALTDVTFILLDPVTGTPITLDDSSFSGGSYFIAVYAKNSSGAPASCGQPFGTMSNQSGSAYYCTSAAPDPKIATFSAAVGPQKIGFAHQLLTNPVASYKYSASAAFAASLPSVPQNTPTIVLPQKIFATTGYESNIYFENICLDSWKNYDQSVSSSDQSIGQHQDERWTWTPSDAFSSSLTFNFIDKNSGQTLTENTVSVLVASSSAGSGLTKKIIAIGDSLVAGGFITGQLLSNAAGDVMAVECLGTQGSGINKHEGRGGWTISDYTTVGRTFYSFTVSGITTPPSINSTQYEKDGSIYLVQNVVLTGGAGTIICSVVSGGAPSASGVLTKSNGGVGDDTITFSASAAVSGNPFWISGALNFAGYLTDNSLALPDWVFIQLGTNDVFNSTTDDIASATAVNDLSALNSLIASIQAAGAGIKIGLVIPPPPPFHQDAFGINYGVGQSRWRFKRNILLWAQAMLSSYAEMEASGIYLVPSNVNIDVVNNMGVAASAPANAYSTVNVTRQINGVHPAQPGYQQIGDAWWAIMKYYA